MTAELSKAPKPLKKYPLPPAHLTPRSQSVPLSLLNKSICDLFSFLYPSGKN